MRVTVLLFAGAREAAGADQVDVQLPDGATYAGLAEALRHAFPPLERLATTARFAADAAYVDLGEPVDPAAEIALIPPVSGG